MEYRANFFLMAFSRHRVGGYGLNISIPLFKIWDHLAIGPEAGFRGSWSV